MTVVEVVVAVQVLDMVPLRHDVREEETGEVAEAGLCQDQHMGALAGPVLGLERVAEEG